jgi:GTP-binding protein
MNILRLPATLRSSVFSTQWHQPGIRRYLTQQVHHSIASDLPLEAATPSTLLKLSPSTLNSYSVTLPPTPPQLKYANNFFHSSPPYLLYSAANFRDLPAGDVPEVAFLGRSNVGKSSLLNALFGRSKVKDARVSKRPGRTRTMNGFGVTGPGLLLGAAPKTGDQKEAMWRRFPRGGLVVVDMPGYGSGSRQVWGQEVLKYLEKRKQLRRTFVLVDAGHGLKASDIEIIMHLRQKGISHQIVLSKVDKLLFDGSKAPGAQKLNRKLQRLQDMFKRMRQRLYAEAQDGRQSVGDLLCCSAEKSIEGHRKLGVDEVRWSVLTTCGMECDEFGQRRRLAMDEVMTLGDDI